MGWFRKVFPFLFKSSPDGAYHWFFVNWCKITTIGNDERYYSFKLNKVFIWEVNVDGMLHFRESEYESKLSILVSEVDQRDVLVTSKGHTIVLLDDRINELKNDCRELSLDKERLQIDLSAANTMISEHSKRIVRVLKDKEAADDLFLDEIVKRDEAIGKFKEFIHNERNNFQNQRSADMDQYNKSIEKLRKEIEMLDKDFVDVAKAMRLYRKDEDRPVRGFRIKGLK